MAGTRAETAVPPPGSDSIASEPATRATRWRIPVSPNPDPSAGAGLRDAEARPRRRGRRGSRRRPCTTASARRDAPACLATFASASWASAAARPRSPGWSAMTLAGDRDLDRDRVDLGPLAGDVGERVRQRPGLERRGHRRLDGAARLGQALAGQPLGVLEVAVAVGRPVARLVGRLELGDRCRSGPGRWCRGSRAPSAGARRARPPRAPGSAAARGARRSRPVAASSRASASRRSSFCSVTFSPKNAPAPMTTVWTHDDHEVEGPRRRASAGSRR